MDTMEITTQIGCKNNCVYCPQSKLIQAYSKRSSVFQMTFGLFKKCIDKIPPGINIGFAGMSEPWLNPECSDMLRYAYSSGHKIEVFTTLVGMDLNDVEILNTVSFKEFCVHLPSAEPVENFSVDLHYLTVLDKLCASSIEASFIINGKNVHPEVKSVMEARRKHCSPNYLHTRANNIHIEGRKVVSKLTGEINCRRKLRYNILLPNGEVVLCCMDYGLEHVLGNLLESNYRSLFRGKEFQRITKGLKDESQKILCRYCDQIAYNPPKKFYRKILPCLLKRINFNHGIKKEFSPNSL